MISLNRTAIRRWALAGASGFAIAAGSLLSLPALTTAAGRHSAGAAQ
jgi:hypothetical protein